MAVKKAAAKVKPATSIKKVAAPAKATATKKVTSAKVSSAAQKVGAALPTLSGFTSTAARGRTGRRRHRRGALWYQREIMRLKLKKRYERVKYGGR